MDTCILCKSSKKDDIQYGDFLKNNHFGVHTFCLYLSSNLSQNGADDEGFLGFLESDIKKEVSRISHLKCTYCNKTYANIGCCEAKCRRAFHLICGLENNAQNVFCYDFRSYCHAHVRKVQQRPSTNETCLICYESLRRAGKKFNSVNVILTPCCRNGWFHKLCLQKFAKTAGYFFKCPLCNDAKTFREKVPACGIFIPNRDAAWELEPNAFADLLERPNECCAQTCKNKKGRKAICGSNPFVMCITCGSTAIHRQCLSNDIKQFHCADCIVDIQEGDSGRESLNSHINSGDNEDEYIDVCHVSDREDLEIINNLIEINNKMPANKRDSGSLTDESDEEMPSTTRNVNKIRRIEECSDENDLDSESKCEDSTKHKRHISGNSECSELSLGSQNSGRIKNETKTSEGDILDNEVIKPRCSFKIRRFSTDSEDQEAGNIQTSSQSTDDEIVTCGKKRKVHMVLSDSEEEPMPAIQKVLDNDLKNLSIITLESDEDDYPLENFSKYIENKSANISCVALRTRRRSNHLNRLEDFTPKKHKRNEENSRDEKPLRNSTKTENSLDISCIAKRTRRRSNYNNRKNEREKKVNPLNISGVVIRTRRKTICAQTDYSKNIVISIDDDDDDEHTESDSRFEISCIANRTRKRRSLKAINEIIDNCSSSNTNSPPLFNIKRGRRCRRLISSNSSEESAAPSEWAKSAPGISNKKTKSISSSPYLDKYPQQNIAAFVRPSYNTKYCKLLSS